MDVRSFLTACLSIVCIFLLAACGDNTSVLRIGSNQWLGYEPVYLSRDLKAISRDDIHLVELSSSTDVMQYLRNGSLHAGMLTLDEVITLLSEGIALRVILVLDISNGSDSILAHPPIQKMTDLKGKRLGVESSALGALMLDSFLELSHLSADQLEIINVTIDQQEQAFGEHKIDAVVTFEPIRSHLLDRGAVEIFDSSQIPGRIVDVLVVREDAMRLHMSQLQALIDGYFVARSYMENQFASSMVKMAPRLQMSPDSLKKSFQGVILPNRMENRGWLGNGGATLLRTASELSQIMLGYGLISQEPDLLGLADDHFLAEGNY